MSDINALIDQNLEKIQALAQEADDALNQVNQLEQLATTLVENITGNEQEVLTGFEALVTQLGKLDQKLRTELKTSKEDLSELLPKAESIMLHGVTLTKVFDFIGANYPSSIISERNKLNWKCISVST